MFCVDKFLFVFIIVHQFTNQWSVHYCRKEILEFTVSFDPDRNERLANTLNIIIYNNINNNSYISTYKFSITLGLSLNCDHITVITTTATIPTNHHHRYFHCTIDFLSLFGWQILVASNSEHSVALLPFMSQCIIRTSFSISFAIHSYMNLQMCVDLWTIA